MAYNADISTYISGKNLKATVSVSREKKSKSNATFTVYGSAVGSNKTVTIPAGKLNNSITFTCSNIHKDYDHGGHEIFVEGPGGSLSVGDYDIRIPGYSPNAYLYTNIELNQSSDPVLYGETTYISIDNQRSGYTYNPSSGWYDIRNNKFNISIGGYSADTDYRYVTGAPWINESVTFTLNVKLNAPYEYYYKYYGDSYWKYSGSSTPDNPPGTRYEGNVAKCSGYIDSDIGGSSYTIILNTPIISINPNTTQLYGTPILAEVSSYYPNSDAGVPSGTEYNWSGDIGTKTTTDSKISFELLKSFMEISCYCTCRGYRQSDKSASVTTGQCQLNKPEIIVSSFTDNILSSIIRDNIPYTNINETVSWVIDPYGRTTTIRNPEGLSTQNTLSLYKDNNYNYIYTESKLKPKWEKQSDLFINPYNRYMVGGLLENLQGYVSSEPNFIPIKVLSCPVNMNNFTEKDIPSVTPYTPFIPQFKDKFGQIISEDSVILIIDNINVQWGTFSPKYFLGNFNYAKVELYNIDDEQTTAVYYLDNNPDKTNNLSIDLSILPTTNPLDGSNYIIPGKHYIVRLTCGYKYGTNSNEVLFKPQYAGIDNYENSNIFESKSFILGGAPEIPDIIVPYKAQATDITTFYSDNLRVLFRVHVLKALRDSGIDMSSIFIKLYHISDVTNNVIIPLKLKDNYLEVTNSSIFDIDDETTCHSILLNESIRDEQDKISSKNLNFPDLTATLYPSSEGETKEGISISIKIDITKFTGFTTWDDCNKIEITASSTLGEGEEALQLESKPAIIYPKHISLIPQDNANHKLLGSDIVELSQAVYTQLGLYYNLYTEEQRSKYNNINTILKTADIKSKLVRSDSTGLSISILSTLEIDKNNEYLSMFDVYKSLYNYDGHHTILDNEIILNTENSTVDLSVYRTKVQQLSDHGWMQENFNNTELFIFKIILLLTTNNPDDLEYDFNIITGTLSDINLNDYGITGSSTSITRIMSKSLNEDQYVVGEDSYDDFNLMSPIQSGLYEKVADEYILSNDDKFNESKTYYYRQTDSYKEYLPFSVQNSLVSGNSHKTKDGVLPAFNATYTRVYNMLRHFL